MIHDTLINYGTMCNTLIQKLVLMRVFVTKLFPKNSDALPLKRIVGGKTQAAARGQVSDAILALIVQNLALSIIF